MRSDFVSVEEALTTLSHAHDGQLVRVYDAAVVHGYAEKVRDGVVLSGKQRRAAYRCLRNYAGELTALGVDWAMVPDPTVGESQPPTRSYTVRRDVVRATVADGRIVVASPYRYKDTCKTIFGSRWNPNLKCWTYPETPTAAQNVLAAFMGQPLETSPEFDALAAQYKVAVDAQSVKHRTDLPDVPVTRTSAWRHQRQAFWFAKDLPAAMLAMDMGTGKTKVAVDLCVNNGAERVLVFCPFSVIPVWQREFRIHAGREYHVLSLDRGGVAERTGQVDDAFHECRCGRPHAAALNYEAMWREPFQGWAVQQDIDYVIFDESHRIKAVTGTVSKTAHRISRRAERRLALTGTPLPQGILDVFGQYRALDPDVFGLSYTSFSHRYALFGGYGNYEVTGYQNTEEFNERFYSIAFRVDADDVLDLPDSVDVTLTCDLSAKARKIYRGVAQELFAAWEDGELTTPNILVKLLRLQQITGGSVPVDGGGSVVVDDGKRRLLEDRLVDVDHPVVVFCRFIHDIEVVEAVARKLGRTFGELSGRRKDAIDGDARMTDVDVAAVQIQTGGVGVDLSRSHHAMYYSVGYSLSDYLQSRRRLLRPGQTHEVVFDHLVVNGTVDEDVYAALADTAEVVDRVLTKMGITR